MTKVQKVKDAVLDTLWWTKVSLRVILVEVVIVLMALGVLYIGNFHVSIEKNVQVISPIGGK